MEMIITQHMATLVAKQQQVHWLLSSNRYHPLYGIQHTAKWVAY